MEKLDVIITNRRLYLFVRGVPILLKDIRLSTVFTWKENQKRVESSNTDNIFRILGREDKRAGEYTLHIY